MDMRAALPTEAGRVTSTLYNLANVHGVDHEAAAQMSSAGTPLRAAQDVAILLVE